MQGIDYDETIVVPGSVDRFGRSLQVGARVRVSESFEHYGDWRNTELIVTGLVAQPNGINVWVKEVDYPEGGHTDGFKPNDFEVVAAAAPKPTHYLACVDVKKFEWDRSPGAAKFDPTGPLFMSNDGYTFVLSEATLQTSITLTHEGEILAAGANTAELAANVKAAIDEARAQRAVQERVNAGLPIGDSHE